MRKVYGLLAIMIALTMTIGAFAPSVIDLHNRSATATLAQSDQSAVICLRNVPGQVWPDMVSYDAMGRAVVTIKPSTYNLNTDSENWINCVLDVYNPDGNETYTITVTSSHPRIQLYRCQPGDCYMVGSVGPSVTFTLAANRSQPIGFYVNAKGLGPGVTLTSTLTIHAQNP